MTALGVSFGYERIGTMLRSLAAICSSRRWLRRRPDSCYCAQHRWAHRQAVVDLSVQGAPKLAPALLANSPHERGEDLHVRHGIDVNCDGGRGHRISAGIDCGLPPRVRYKPVSFLPSPRVQLTFISLTNFYPLKLSDINQL